MTPYQYQPYIPNWQGQLAANMQQSVFPQMPTVQPYQQPVNGVVKVNGPQSAMQIQLPPNSTSQPLIDANFDGKRGMMYVVSTDGTGTKSLEWYDFTLHAEEQPVQVDGTQFVSRQEFNEFTAKVNAAIGVLNGSNAAAPATGTAAAQPDAGHDARQDWHAQEPSGGQPAGRGGAAVQV